MFGRANVQMGSIIVINLFQCLWIASFIGSNYYGRNYYTLKGNQFDLLEWFIDVLVIFLNVTRS